ncbi:hypothetical protein AX16_005727 [Volvariella volvacea WC 439]|nr:hypothetical protein AX16_005727 [Volvariella volvacea WC 439]
MSRLRFPPPNIYWPSLIVIGQLFLLFAAWGFYTATAIKPVALPESTAERAARSASAVTLIVTLISTIIAIGSSYLYSHSVRYALTCHLTRAMPLHRLALAIKIARARPLFSLTFYWWMLITLVNVGILGAQTAAWNTLLTPRRIIIGHDATGSGINVLAPEFVQFAATYVRDPRWRAPDNAVTMSSVMQASGVAAVNAEFGLPAILNFNEVSFVNATRGIMPAFLEDTASSIETASQYLASVHVDTKSMSLTGFNTNITLEQQGLTAQVECQPRNPSLHAVDRVRGTLPSRGVEIEGMTFVMDVICPDGSNTSAMAITQIFQNRTEGDAVLISLCPTAPASPVYEVVIHGEGELYSVIGNLSCIVTPKNTTVQVNYISSTGFHNSSSTTFTSIMPLREDNIRTLDEVVGPLTFLNRHLSTTQNLAGNDLGNILLEFYYPERSMENIQRAAAAYLTGVLEFSSTLLRAEFTRTNTRYWPNDQIPSAVLYDLTGTYSTETMGWDNRKSPLVPLLLIIPTLVAFSAFLFVISAIHQTKTSSPDARLPQQSYLDLGDFLHVMAVSYPDSRLPSLEKGEGDFMKRSMGLSAGLAPIPGGDSNHFNLVINDPSSAPNPTVPIPSTDNKSD